MFAFLGLSPYLCRHKPLLKRRQKMADFRVKILISRFVTVSIDDVDTDTLGLKSRIKDGEFDDLIQSQIDKSIHAQFDFIVCECEKS